MNLYAKIVSQSRIVILTRRVPDLLAMITERRAEKAEIDEAIEVLERVRSSKLRGVTDHRRTCRRALRRLSIWSRTTAFLKPIQRVLLQGMRTLPARSRALALGVRSALCR